MILSMNTVLMTMAIWGPLKGYVRLHRALQRTIAWSSRHNHYNKNDDDILNGNGNSSDYSNSNCKTNQHEVPSAPKNCYCKGPLFIYSRVSFLWGAKPVSKRNVQYIVLAQRRNSVELGPILITVAIALQRALHSLI